MVFLNLLIETHKLSQSLTMHLVGTHPPHHEFKSKYYFWSSTYKQVKSCIFIEHPYLKVKLFRCMSSFYYLRTLLSIFLLQINIYLILQASRLRQITTFDKQTRTLITYLWSSEILIYMNIWQSLYMQILNHITITDK